MVSEAKKIEQDIRNRLNKKNKTANYFEVPRVVKVVVSSGIGAVKEDKNAIETISNDLALITGQKVKVNLSKKSVSSFKLRVKQPVGLSVTLRRKKMYDFLNKLANIALPRVRDFKGLNLSSFDRNGNYCIGISEQIIMPEIKYDTTNQMFGFQVNIFTSAKNDQDAKVLLEELGFPFNKIDNTPKV